MGMRYAALIPRVFYSAAQAAQTIFQLNAPSDATVIIHEFFLSFDKPKTSNYENVNLNRVSTLGTGTDLTEVRCESGFALPGSVCQYDHSSEATIVETIIGKTMRVEWHHLPVPAARIIVSPGGRVALSTPTNPRLGFTPTGYFKWEEVGG